ncbi:electron transport complex subunit RsxB [Orrella daihaiensis]|uniref:Electron transport complex subunit RsxB n=1 Tax=Orrella daihaiensis TaxID=2782176 RepID=A0ABY4AKM1_9BURK|nr:electron transport complex subunit RsxB [Orrella daihaiensis]UOD49612.1 electron transport complex subunit RsxB [Orrella daihaiensis]
MASPELIEQINRVLPQTQCTKCGFDGCEPYAQAMAEGLADINRCPPGGDAGVAKLSQMLNKPIKSIDPECGVPGPLHVAVIDEQHCIGCTLCIKACPVDAIVGANKRMHTVLTDWCTGCDLCLAPCPVDCIEMIPAAQNPEWTDERAQLARLRYDRRNQRLSAPAEHQLAPVATDADKQAAVAAALARARARRGQT